MASLIAYGNHGKDIEAIWFRARRDKPLTIYDDDPTRTTELLDFITGKILISVNDPTIRHQIADRFRHLRGTSPLIDPSVIRGTDIEMGRGVVVAPGAVLLRSVTLGDHVHVNYLASMTRCDIGDYSTISPAAVICGNVTIGEDCYIGANATICERSTIGNRVTVGAGAVVLPWSIVPDNTRVIGVWKNP